MDSVEHSNTMQGNGVRTPGHGGVLRTEIKHQWKLSRQRPTGLSLMGSINYPKERHHTDTEYEVRASIYCTPYILLNKPASQKRSTCYAWALRLYILRSPTPDPPGSEARPGNMLEYGVSLGYTESYTECYIKPYLRDAIRPVVTTL